MFDFFNDNRRNATRVETPSRNQASQADYALVRAGAPIFAYAPKTPTDPQPFKPMTTRSYTMCFAPPAEPAPPADCSKGRKSIYCFLIDLEGFAIAARLEDIVLLKSVPAPSAAELTRH